MIQTELVGCYHAALQFMGCLLASNHGIDAIGVVLGAILDYAVAEIPALVFIKSSPDVLLHSDQQMLLAIACCDAHIFLARHRIGEDVYYMSTV